MKRLLNCTCLLMYVKNLHICSPVFTMASAKYFPCCFRVCVAPGTMKHEQLGHARNEASTKAQNISFYLSNISVVTYIIIHH